MFLHVFIKNTDDIPRLKKYKQTVKVDILDPSREEYLRFLQHELNNKMNFEVDPHSLALRVYDDDERNERNESISIESEKSNTSTTPIPPTFTLSEHFEKIKTELDDEVRRLQKRIELLASKVSEICVDGNATKFRNSLELLDKANEKVDAVFTKSLALCNAIPKLQAKIKFIRDREIMLLSTR